jgi:hypothetical protein
LILLNLHRKGCRRSGHWELGITPEFFLISNFRRILNLVFFLLGNSPASEFYVPTFLNTLAVPAMRMELTECSETSEHKIQTPGNYRKERIKHSGFARSRTVEDQANRVEMAGRGTFQMHTDCKLAVRLTKDGNLLTFL